MSTPAFQLLPIAEIEESPLNPRKVFADEALAELAKSIAAVGILQPVLVRPVNGHYELVYGHRRVRAARVAGLEEVPATIRELEDSQVLEIAIIENCSRTDISAIEEAEAYQQLHEVHGYHVDDIAAKVGKSKAYVYGRMKLCALTPESRAAVAEQQLSDSIALLIARIPAELQPQAIGKLVQWRTEIDEVIPYRTALEIIRRDFMLRLEDAPFDTKDADLVISAGACSSCPKRTGAQPELFADVGSADVCTDPGCFAEKRDAAWAKQRAAAEKKGLKVVDDAEAKKMFGLGGHLTDPEYIDLDETDYDDEKERTYGEVLGKKAKGEVILARDPQGHVRHLVPTELVEGEKALPSTIAADHEAWNRDREIARRTNQLVIVRLVEAVEKKGPKDALFDALFLLAIEGGDLAQIAERRGLIKGEDDADDPEAVIKASWSKLKGNARWGLLLEASLYGDHIEGLCKAYGVDAKKIEVEVKAALKAEAKAAEKGASDAAPADETPPPAKPAAKKKGAKPAKKKAGKKR